MRFYKTFTKIGFSKRKRLKLSNRKVAKLSRKNAKKDSQPQTKQTGILTRDKTLTKGT